MESDRPTQMPRQDILDLAGAVLGCAIDLAKRLPCKGRGLSQHYVILCYSEILQDASACYLLMGNSAWGAVYKLLRPMIESCMHLLNIIQDESYIDEILFQACDSLERQLKPHEKNQVSPALMMSDAGIAKCRSTISGYMAMISEGRKTRTVPDQYKSVGMESFYVFSYKRYSQAVHGNFLALINSHSTGDDYQDVVVAKDIDEIEFYTLVSEFVHIIHDAARRTMMYFDFEPDQETEKHSNVFNVALCRLMEELRRKVEATPC